MGGDSGWAERGGGGGWRWVELCIKEVAAVEEEEEEEVSKGMQVAGGRALEDVLGGQLYIYIVSMLCVGLEY